MVPSGWGDSSMFLNFLHGRRGAKQALQGQVVSKQNHICPYLRTSLSRVRCIVRNYQRLKPVFTTLERFESTRMTTRLVARGNFGCQSLVTGHHRRQKQELDHGTNRLERDSSWLFNILHTSDKVMTTSLVPRSWWPPVGTFIRAEGGFQSCGRRRSVCFFLAIPPTKFWCL